MSRRSKAITATAVAMTATTKSAIVAQGSNVPPGANDFDRLNRKNTERSVNGERLGLDRPMLSMANMTTSTTPHHPPEPSGKPRHDDDRGAQHGECDSACQQQTKTGDAGCQPRLDHPAVLVATHRAARAEQRPRG